jgi:hypothetical protein
MTDYQSGRDRSLVAEARADKAEAELLTDTFNESTGLTWLWSILFAICIVTLGFGVFFAPFLAYPGWKKRARRKAENMTLISRARRG